MTDKNKKELTHINKEGQVNMVDVSSKPITAREAVATGQIQMEPETLELIKTGQIEKGAVLETARLAGIMAAKKDFRSYSTLPSTIYFISKNRI